MSGFKSVAVKATLLVMLLTLASVNALADFTFDVAGSTTGRFYLGSLPLGTSLPGLSFTGTNFRQAVTPGTDMRVDLGTFRLATLLSYYDPFDFKLSIRFVEPIFGATLFHADLSGLATMFGGSTKLRFDGGPQHFAFAGPQGSGTFDLVISDVKVSNFSTASIEGKITNIAANPEPAAVLLTGAFISGVIVLFRKRLRNC